MSQNHNMNWDVNIYKEVHESEEQWQLRKAFLMKWKDHYPEERLLCLARVFTNIEFMGCRYPSEVMQEVARLSADVADNYRNAKKSKLQRTFVSASDAAEDRAKGVKRQGGVVFESPPKKTTRIEFIPQGQNNSTETNGEDIEMNKNKPQTNVAADSNPKTSNKTGKQVKTEEIYPKTALEINGVPDFRRIDYMEDLYNTSCLDPRDFNERMFDTEFGQFVLVIRPWTDMINNLFSTCATLKIPATQEHKQGVFTVTLNGHTLVTTKGDKITARANACRIVWNKLRRSTVVVVFKEQWVSRDDAPISMTDMADKKHEFGEPIEHSVAMKMMKLMGWKGGGLGADSQGIEEPIKPHLRMVRRSGLGHEGGLEHLKRAGLALMRRRRVALDADLVFASDFTSEERAVLHQCANQCGLNSKSYGKGAERFLVVTNKLRPLSLVRALVECGGETAKYRVFIPASIGNSRSKQDR